MDTKILAQNKKAYFDYTVKETYEAGLVLTGPEVKSVREGGATLVGAYLTFRDTEAWIAGMQIKPYSHTRSGLQEPDRLKKLLLSKKEINHLAGVAKQKGLTIIPLQIFAKGNLIKIKIGVGVGKKNYDKRAALKKKSIEKRMRSEDTT